jgi:hypothetical protein
MAQSGTSLRRINSVAFGAKRTLSHAHVGNGASGSARVSLAHSTLLFGSTEAPGKRPTATRRWCPPDLFDHLPRDDEGRRAGHAGYKRERNAISDVIVEAEDLGGLEIEGDEVGLELMSMESAQVGGQWCRFRPG